MELAEMTTVDMEQASNGESLSGAKRIYINRKEQLYSKRRYWILRRVQDILLSGIALIVLAPIM